MSNLFKYKIGLDADSTVEERYEPRSPYIVPYLAFVIVCTIMTTVFSGIVMVLDYCFPGCLDGTYLKLFF